MLACDHRLDNVDPVAVAQQVVGRRRISHEGIKGFRASIVGRAFALKSSLVVMARSCRIDSTRRTRVGSRTATAAPRRSADPACPLRLSFKGDVSTAP